MLNRIIVTSLLLLSVSLWSTAATVTLPKTGQTLCYDSNGAIDCAGTGQDGETQIGSAWPSPRFTANNDGTVTDQLTGLIWLRDALCAALNPPPPNPGLSLQGGRDWASAVIAANTLTSGQCGLSDGSGAGTWRLPNVNELESLMDLSVFSPPLPANNYFIDIPQNAPNYWTSTITPEYFPGSNAIGADMFSGTIQGDAKTSLKNVWPVKGNSTSLAKTGQNACWDSDGNWVDCIPGAGTDGELQKGLPWPDPRFVNNGNGTTTDALTGLIWPSNVGCLSFSNISSQGKGITAAKALANGACGLTDGSAPGDWRLPNRKEMRSLIEYRGIWLPSTDSFINSPDHGWYWTSDSNPVPPFTAEKWMVKSEGLDWLSSEVYDPAYKQLLPGFILPVRGGLTVNNPTITITSALNLTYDGTPKVVTARTSPAGLAVTVTYDGSTTPPTDFGSYAVAAMFSDHNYQGTASGTLNIGKASGKITLGSLSQIYDGTAKRATATTSPAGGNVIVTYSGTSTPPIGAGSYGVVATIDDSNFLPNTSASGTLIVAKASGTIALGGLSQTYDGTGKTVTATTSPAGAKVTFSYAGSANAPVNAGSYPVTATINDPNFLTSSAPGTLVIAKAAGTVTLGSLNQTYDGTAKNATATTVPSGKTVTFSYAGSSTAPLNAGSYPVVATLTDTNFQGTASGTLIIAKATPAITWTSPPAIFTVTALSSTQLDAAASPSGGTFAYTPASGTVLAAGTRVLSVLYTPATTDGVNYTTATATTNLTVNLGFSIAFAAGNNGTLSGSTSQAIGQGGGTSPVTALPATGYRFLNWTGTGGFVTSTANPLTVTNITASQAITANFAPYPSGDINGDGKVDVADALMALRIAVELIPMDSKYLLNGDVAPLVNGEPQLDGKIDIADALLILRKCVGLVNW